MGKSAFNPLSQWKGRVGGQVYKVVNGKQVIMPYKQVERKGGSIAQLSVRARFALAGKFSKIVPPEILRGLGSNKQNRRSIFNRSIARQAVVTIVDSGFRADIAPENIVFSNGDVTLLEISQVLMSNAGRLSATISNVPENINAVLAIAVCENADKEYDRIEYEIVPVDSDTHTATVDMETGVPQGQHVRLYYIPLSVTDQARSFLSTTEYDEHAQDQYTLTMLLTSVEGAYTWRRSQFVDTISSPIQP